MNRKSEGGGDGGGVRERGSRRMLERGHGGQALVRTYKQENKFKRIKMH